METEKRVFVMDLKPLVELTRGRTDYSDWVEQFGEKYLEKYREFGIESWTVVILKNNKPIGYKGDTEFFVKLKKITSGMKRHEDIVEKLSGLELSDYETIVIMKAYDYAYVFYVREESEEVSEEESLMEASPSLNNEELKGNNP